MERQIEQLISVINKRINFDEIYIINQLKRDLEKNGYDYIPSFKKHVVTKIEISQSYINYLKGIVKCLESILK